MALSQLQCLDEHHVNPRTHESKPEFFYCEEQRLALETLLRDGREAFVKHLQDSGLRGFLSDPELETLAGAVEPYDPDAEIFLGVGEDDEHPLSLHYWPELSDTSVPQMDLGWPDTEAYRGVTRTTVYTQPPLDGQAHIKGVVRKMIAQAQKVIAVAMDVFTDVDIFRDLLDAGFKRRVSVYILLDRTSLPHFLSMCERANMHAGHLKHLRVRCTEGTEFCTRSCTRVRGQLGHRFMFVDGDKAVSGSYSFTWMSSRLDRNLITVVTGQAVEGFDRLFRFLYMSSSFVDLRQVAKEPGPEPEPLPQPAVIPPPADLARKLYNPKYALVAAGNPSLTASTDLNSPKEPQNSKSSKNPEGPESKKRRRGRGSMESVQEAPVLHPGLTNLEKACLISYLPTWPEPDPPSDVIGFINVRDSSKPGQVHLQRSEMFETSQAIRFSSPVSLPQETLPEVATPRQLPAKHVEVNKLQPTQNKTNAGGSVMDGVQQAELHAEPGDIKAKGQAPEQKSSASGAKSGPDKDPTVALDTESEPHSSAPADQQLPQTDSHTRQRNSSGTTPNIQTSLSVSSTSPSEKQHTHIPTVPSKSATSVCTSVPSTSSSSLPPPISSCTAPNPPLHPSSASLSLTSTPPIPKPRTVQLIIKEGGQRLPEVSIVRRPESLAGTGPPLVHSEPDVANVVQTSPEKERETVPPPQNNRGGKTGAPKDTEDTGNPEEAPQQKQDVTLQDTKGEETVGLCDEGAATQSVAGTQPQAQSDALITDAPKADSGNIQERSSKEVETKSSTLTDCEITPKTETDAASATVQTDTEAPEKNSVGCGLAQVPNEKSENVIQHKPYGAHETQDKSYCELNPADIASTHTANAHVPKHGGEDGTHSPQDEARKPNVAKHNTHVGVASQESQQAPRAQGDSHAPQRPQRLHLSGTQTPHMRTPTPDGFLPSTPTPVSRTHTPDPRPYSPDFRTPTPDVSDGYISPRDDSTLSTTSDEYYECSDSPFHDLVLDRAVFRNHGTTVDSKSTHTNAAIAHTNAANAMSGTMDRKTARNESLSGPARVSSSSPLLDKVQMGEEKDATNETNGRNEDEKRRTERASQGTERTDSDGAETTANHLQRAEESTEVVEKDKEAQPRPTKRKGVTNQSAAERLVDGGAAPGESTNKAADAKCLSPGDLKLEKVSPDRKRPDKEKVAEQAALRLRSVERRDRPRPVRETEGPKLPRGKQLNSGASSPSRPLRPPRPFTAAQPVGARSWASHRFNQAESKSLDRISSPRRPPLRLPLTAGAFWSATGRKQAEVSHGPQSSFPRQPLAAHGRAGAGQSQSQHPYPRPRASNIQSHLHPHSHSQVVSVREARAPEEGRAPFTFTFGRLYNLKGLKEKMSKLPAQNKRGTSSLVRGRKNTS